MRVIKGRQGPGTYWYFCRTLQILQSHQNQTSVCFSLTGLMSSTNITNIIRQIWVCFYVHVWLYKQQSGLYRIKQNQEFVLDGQIMLVCLTPLWSKRSATENTQKHIVLIDFYVSIRSFVDCQALLYV